MRLYVYEVILFKSLKMNWERFLLYGIISIVSTIFLATLKDGHTQEIETNVEGNFELRMSKLYQFLGIGSILLFGGFSIYGVLFGDKTDAVAAIITFIVLGGLGALMTIFYRNHKVWFNQQIITIQNWRGRKTSIEWGDIVKMHFNHLGGYLKIETKDKVLKIHQHLIGLKEFTDLMEKKTKWTAKKLRIPLD